MKLKRIFSLQAAAFVVFLAASSIALAAGEALTLEKVVGLITDSINLLIGLAVTVTIGILIYGGFQMAYSRGVQKDFDVGKETIKNASIGLLVILGVGIIIATISSFAQNPSSIVR
ncbi:MAG: hypothetical protein KBC02_00935 [Candidatus Pacebacteria bacterium]|nr:hypothetical protein [Candidatus Paceibacterota bacterium]